MSILDAYIRRQVLITGLGFGEHSSPGELAQDSCG